MVETRIKEEWVLPPFEKLDIIHSTNGMPENGNGNHRRPDLDNKKKAKGDVKLDYFQNNE